MNACLPEMCLHAESSLQEKTRAICLHSLCGLQQAASTSGESAPRWLSGTQQEVPCVPRNRPQGGRRKSDRASSPQRWYFTRWREQPRAVRAPARSRDTGDQGSGVKASAGPAVRLSSKGGPVVSPPGSAESGQFCYCFLGTGMHDSDVRFCGHSASASSPGLPSVRFCVQASSCKNDGHIGSEPTRFQSHLIPGNHMCKDAVSK